MVKFNEGSLAYRTTAFVTASYESDDAGNWVDIVSAELDLKASTKTVRALASFQVSWDTGVNEAWDPNFRVLIAGDASDTYIRRLSGTGDKGSCTVSHMIEGQTGVVTVTLQTRDDGPFGHTVSVGPASLFAEGY